MSYNSASLAQVLQSSMRNPKCLRPKLQLGEIRCNHKSHGSQSVARAHFGMLWRHRTPGRGQVLDSRAACCYAVSCGTLCEDAEANGADGAEGDGEEGAAVSRLMWQMGPLDLQVMGRSASSAR